MVKKVNVSPVLVNAVAGSVFVLQKGIALASTLKVSEKFSALKDHSLCHMVIGKKDLIWTIVGAALVIHGGQFRNLFLCTLVVDQYLRLSGWEAGAKMIDDIQKCVDKSEDAKTDDKSEDAKTYDKKAFVAQEQFAIAQKVLKRLDSDAASNFGFGIFVAFVASISVMHGGLLTTVFVAKILVETTYGRVNEVLKFSFLSEMEQWCEFFVRLFLWVVVLALSFLVPQFTFALCAAAYGSNLLMSNLVGVVGERAQGVTSGRNGLIVYVACVLLGWLWQSWTFLSGGSIAWYFNMLYIVAVIPETILSLF